MVQKEFSSALEKNGISKINSMNEKFDPNLHQAMMEVEKMILMRVLWYKKFRLAI